MSLENNIYSKEEYILLEKINNTLNILSGASLIEYVSKDEIWTCSDLGSIIEMEKLEKEGD